MTDFYTKFMTVLENKLSEEDLTIFLKDSDISSFLKEITFEDEKNPQNGSEIMEGLEAAGEFDSGATFGHRDIYFLLYRFGASDDQGYMLWASRKPEILIQEMEDPGQTIDDKIRLLFINAMTLELKSTSN